LVKWISCLSSKQAVWVRFLHGRPKVSMLIVPVNISRQIEIAEPQLVAGSKIPVRLTSVAPLLEQLGISDLKNDVYAYAAIMGPHSKIRVHKDEQYPVKWSLIIPPVGHEDVNIEIVSIKEGAIEQSEGIGLTPVGTQYVSYREEDCVLVESWNLKYGACYFSPTDYWHRAVNNTDKPCVIFSIRSTKIEIEEVLKRIS
jgi:hypothetical protein